MKGKRWIAFFLTICLVLTLVPMEVYAYVGALTEQTDGITVTLGSQTYGSISNDYMTIDVMIESATGRPMFRTLPTQGKRSGDYSYMRFFTRNGYPDEYWLNSSWKPTAPANGKLSVDGNLIVYTGSLGGGSLKITYEMVRLDEGSHTGVSPNMIYQQPDDPGTTWALRAKAFYKAPQKLEQEIYCVRMETVQNGLGKNGHSMRGALFSNTYSYSTHQKNNIYLESKTYDLGYQVSEIYTSSFSFANEFVVTGGFNHGSWGYEGDGQGGWIGTQYSGAVNHASSYGNPLAVLNKASVTNKVVSIAEDSLKVLGENASLVLEYGYNTYYVGGPTDEWKPMGVHLCGYRDLCTDETYDENEAADPSVIPQDATAVGIVWQNGGHTLVTGDNRSKLEAAYGPRLSLVITGKAKKDKDDSWTFEENAAQIGAALKASWDSGEGRGLRLKQSGNQVQISAAGVRLSSPAFTFFRSKAADGSGLEFLLDHGKLSIAIDPDKNEAVLHLDIPGAVCELNKVTLTGTALDFSGEMGINTSVLNIADLSVSDLRMDYRGKQSSYGVSGIRAKGSVSMDRLLGIDVADVSADIDTFAETERYSFELSFDVGVLSTEGKLELKRLNNGALVPNNFSFDIEGEPGIPLVPPVIVARLKGGGGSIKNLADTINGDYYGIPPIELSVNAKGSILEVLEGTVTGTIGAGYYKINMTDADLFKLKGVIKEVSHYGSLNYGKRQYKGITYTGAGVVAGWKLELGIPRGGWECISAGGEFNWSAFSGLAKSGEKYNVYIMLGADGSVYGKVAIPKKVKVIGGLELFSKKLAFALGGQTVINNVTSGKINENVSSVVKNISGYGSVSYTDSFLGFKYRIYYIIHNKDVGFQVAGWGKKLSALGGYPGESAAAVKTNLVQLVAVSAIVPEEDEMEESEGFIAEEEVPESETEIGGIEEETFETESEMEIEAESESETETETESEAEARERGVTANGVTLKQLDAEGKEWSMKIGAEAPEQDKLLLSLAPLDGIIEDSFVQDLVITDKNNKTFQPNIMRASEGEEETDKTNGAIAGIGTAEDKEALTIALGRAQELDWTEVTIKTAKAVDISCDYAKPYAKISSVSLSGSTLQYTLADLDPEKEYILRTYLGEEAESADYLLSQEAVSSDKTNGSLVLPATGTAAVSGNYPVTVVLLERNTTDVESADEECYLNCGFMNAGNMGYVNSESPAAPTGISVKAVGNEVVCAEWNPVASADGYLVNLYEQVNGAWENTGAGYEIKRENGTWVNAVEEDGKLKLKMALTADTSYKAGVTAVINKTIDKGDGTNEVLPLRSGESMSEEVWLPAAQTPVLSYDPIPDASSDVKTLTSKDGTRLQIASDVDTIITVERMDTDEVVAASSEAGRTFTMNLPYGQFEGTLMLKITADYLHDGLKDTTTDYLILQKDGEAPVLCMNAPLVKADSKTRKFNISGVTEAKASLEIQKADGSLTQIQAKDDGSFSFQDVMKQNQNAVTVFVTALDQTGNRSEEQKVSAYYEKPVVKPEPETNTPQTDTPQTDTPQTEKPKKEKAVIKLNVKSIPMQVKQSTKVVKVIKKAKWDSVASWKSSNKKVATVSAKGKIKAKKVGKAVITVKLKSGLSAKVTVKVQKKKVKTKSIKLSAKTLTLKKKQSVKLYVTRKPLTTQDKVKFLSSNKKVATVTSKGVVKAKKKGTVKITVLSGKKKAICKVKVK